VITDSVGTKVQSLTYFPYGATRTNTSSSTPAIDVPYKYTGKELDSSTNLFTMRRATMIRTWGDLSARTRLCPIPEIPKI
jgi:hypothetical protein